MDEAGSIHYRNFLGGLRLQEAVVFKCIARFVKCHVHFVVPTRVQTYQAEHNAVKMNRSDKTTEDYSLTLQFPVGLLSFIRFWFSVLQF